MIYSSYFATKGDQHIKEILFIFSTPGEGVVTGALTTPDGDRVPVQVKNNKDGTYDVLSTPKEPGPHNLDIKYEDVPIPGSPFKYDAVEGGPDRVKCFGPGELRLQKVVKDLQKISLVPRANVHTWSA